MNHNHLVDYTQSCSYYNWYCSAERMHSCQSINWQIYLILYGNLFYCYRRPSSCTQEIHSQMFHCGLFKFHIWIWVGVTAMAYFLFAVTIFFQICLSLSSKFGIIWYLHNFCNRYIYYCPRDTICLHKWYCDIWMRY